MRSCGCKYFNYKNSNTTFIYEGDTNGENVFSLSPLYINTIFPRIKRSISQKSLFMSATISNIDSFVREIGISNESYKFIDIPSRFPVDNRRIVFYPATRMNYGNCSPGTKEFSVLCESIINIVATHSDKGDSGVIFTPSYKLAKDIDSVIRSDLESFGYRVIINNNSDERNPCILDFTTTHDKVILISPSFSEGVNFNDDISRFAIIPKHPFLSLSSNRIRRRSEIDQDWYISKSINTLIQQSGRSVRHEGDYAVTYILDINSRNIYNSNKDKMPSWFNDAVIQ